MKIRILATMMSIACSAMSSIATSQITHLDPDPVVDIDSRLIAGRGCTQTDEIYYYSMGNSRSVVEFYPSNLAINGVAGLSTCIVRIPITVPAGYKLKVERQIASAYADLSNSAKASISIRSSALSPLGIQTKDLTPGYSGYVSVGTRQNDAQAGECAFEDKKGIMRFDLAAGLSDSSRSAHDQLEIYRAVLVLKLEECN